METRRHRIQIYTPLSVVEGEIELPANSLRLSDYLRPNAGSTLIVHDATVVYADGAVREGVQIQVTAPACLAVVDREAAVPGDPLMRHTTRQVRVEVAYAAGLRIEGDLHLPEAAEYDAVLAGFSANNSLRVLTDCIIRLGGEVAGRGDAVLTDLRGAAHILRIPTAERGAALEEPVLRHLEA